MMHGTFILFTAMSVDSGGLGWSEMRNGWIFAFIGVGVIVQGGLIGPLSDRFGMHRLMAGTVLCGLWIASLPYVPRIQPMANSRVFSRFSNWQRNLFSPTQSSLLTFEAKKGGHELGMVMGAQEGYGALARF